MIPVLIAVTSAFLLGLMLASRNHQTTSYESLLLDSILLDMLMTLSIMSQELEQISPDRSETWQQCYFSLERATANLSYLLESSGLIREVD